MTAGHFIVEALFRLAADSAQSAGTQREGIALQRHLREFMGHGSIVFISAVCLLTLVILLRSPYRPGIWGALLAGVVIWFFAEDFTHRYILHGVLSRLIPAAGRYHVTHHQNPTDRAYIFIPNYFNIPNYIILWSLAFLVTRSSYLATGVVLSGAAAQLYYEWVHFVAHRPIAPLTPWG
jgi:4-hydroxysphinganine ceramide fatty acyl 2-hydroxylase